MKTLFDIKTICELCQNKILMEIPFSLESEYFNCNFIGNPNRYTNRKKFAIIEIEFNDFVNFTLSDGNYEYDLIFNGNEEIIKNSTGFCNFNLNLDISCRKCGSYNQDILFEIKENKIIKKIFDRNYIIENEENKYKIYYDEMNLYIDIEKDTKKILFAQKRISFKCENFPFDFQDLKSTIRKIETYFAFS